MKMAICRTLIVGMLVSKILGPSEQWLIQKQQGGCRSTLSVGHQFLGSRHAIWRIPIQPVYLGRNRLCGMTRGTYLASELLYCCGQLCMEIAGGCHCK